MKQSYGMIAGASALALAGVVAVQTGLVGPSSSEVAPEVAAPATPPPPEEVVAAAPAAEAVAPDAAETDAATAEAEARLAGVETALAGLESTLAERETTLAEREAALAALGETLAGRDATVEEMTRALAERDAELTALRAEVDALRTELAGLRDRFAFDIQLAALKSGEAADAPAAASPVAEAAVAEAAVERALTSIQFDTGSARLSPGGQVHAAAAAVMLADMKIGTVRLVGFADRTGSAARNRALAEERARAVADFLVAQGVPAQLIETSGITEGALPVPTEAGVPEPLNRSVSIVAVPLPAA